MSTCVTREHTKYANMLFAFLAFGQNSNVPNEKHVCGMIFAIYLMPKEFNVFKYDIPTAAFDFFADNCFIPA